MLPALYPFESNEQWLAAAPAFFSSDNHRLVRALVEKRLIPVVSGPEIAIYLGISPKLVSAMVMQPDRYYRSFEIPKRSGGSRTITAPRVFLKTVQRYILDCIVSQLVPHEAACGFRRGYNCGSGAARHIGRPYLWNIDLESFFPSITKAQVKEVFISAGYPNPAAYFLAGLCCLGGRLPQGAPTSPALANLVCANLDRVLTEESRRSDIVYTRYADDLSFSGLHPIAAEFRTHIARRIGEFGFHLQRKKTRLMGPAVRREVTGLTVNQQVSIPRPIRRRLRAYFHQISRNPAAFSHERQRATGFARWLFDYHKADGAHALQICSTIPPPASKGVSLGLP